MADTRNRFTVTAEVTLMVESTEEAGQMVEALLAPLVMVSPFSATYPPKVVGVRLQGDVTLSADEKAALRLLEGRLDD